MPSPFITLQHLLPKHALSRLGSRLAASQTPWLSGPLIRWFKKTYEVDLSEAQIQDPEGFASFNDFFTRALQPSARPIDTNPLGIACPADGTISQCGKIEAGQLLQAKGITYSLAELAASDDVERYNLILWGDRDMNPLVGPAIDAIGGVEWSAEKITIGGVNHPAAGNVLAMIYPNPRNPKRYVVFNSGPTFREGHDRTNSLQNPKLPDWAIIGLETPPTDTAPGEILEAGFFDEYWRSQ